MLANTVFFIHKVFFICVRRKKEDLFLIMNNLYKSWESLVTLQLPTDCCVVFWTKQKTKRYFYFFYKPNKKRNKFHIWNSHVTMTIRDAYISNEKQLQNHSLTFFYINNSLLLATSFLSWSPLAYNTTASSNKLTCTDYVDFRKCQDIFGQFSWSKNDYDDLDVKIKVFKEDDNKKFRLVQNLTIGETDFNRFIRLRN